MKIKGLYRGVHAAVPRASMGSMVQLTSFAYIKDYLKQYETFEEKPILNAFGSSMIVGIFVAASMTPFDLIATRLYNQGKIFLYSS